MPVVVVEEAPTLPVQSQEAINTDDEQAQKTEDNQNQKVDLVQEQEPETSIAKTTEEAQPKKRGTLTLKKKAEPIQA